MPSISLNDIQQRVAAGETKLALEGLQPLVREQLPDRLDDVDLLMSSFSLAEREYLRGLITQEEFGTRQQRVHQAILQLLHDLRRDQAAGEVAERLALHDYHRYTCDRVEQTDSFSRLFGGVEKIRHARFYYLYGGDLQSHEGLFYRFAYELEGRLLDYLNPELPAACQVLKIELTFDYSRQLDLYKENLLKALFAAFSVAVNEHEPLLQKNLAYVIQKSPKLQGLSERDFVCIYLHISQYDWDKNITPVVAGWFIHEFCQTELPGNSPTFLFFFAIEYDEQEAALISEVREAVGKSDSIEALPELGMVQNRDIGRWLEKYKKIAPGTRERKDLLQQHFGSSDEHYMEDVEIALQRIIDDFNKRLIR